MTNTAPYIIVKDHSVSNEEFQLFHNKDFDLLETHPQPSLENLTAYYKSEDYISHTSSKRNLFEKVYHLVRKKTLKRKLKLINSYASSEKQLLDIGCGTGDFLKVALQDNWNITGIEPNKQARQIANIKINGSVFETEHLQKLESHSFNVITLWHVLEHLPKLEEHISIFKKLLKPNGTLIIAVPNFKSYDAEYYNNFWAAFDVPRHLWHFSKTAIQRLFLKEEMKVVKMYPMKFDAYYVSLLSEKYKSGKMHIFNAIHIGFSFK